MDCFPKTYYALYDFDLRATHARTLLPAALASVSFGFVLVRVRVKTSPVAVLNSPYNKTSDVFSPEYKANTSRRIGFSADVITNTSLNIRFYTAFAMHIVGICPNMT